MSTFIGGLSSPLFPAPSDLIAMFTGPQAARSRAAPSVSRGEEHTSGSMVKVGAAVPAPWSMTLSQNVERLRRLPAGWDGPRSLPINPSLLNMMTVLIRASIAPLGDRARAPFVVPLSNGGVQAEWHTLRGEMEFELGANGTASVWVRDHSTEHEFEIEGPKAISEFLRWAPWVAQGQPDVSNVPPSEDAAIFSIAA